MVDTGVVPTHHLWYKQVIFEYDSRRPRANIKTLAEVATKNQPFSEPPALKAATACQRIAEEPGKIQQRPEICRGSDFHLKICR